MLSVKEAQECIKKEINIENRSVYISTKESLGYTLAEDVYSAVNIPYYPTSTRDGYAWNSKWKSNCMRLNKSGITSAGKQTPSSCIEETVYISTGGQLDETMYDSVVMIEDVSIIEEDGHTYVKLLHKENTKQWEYVRKVGSDISKRERLCTKGTIIQSSMVGLLLLAHIRLVKVEWNKIDIHIFSSGNELFDIDDIPDEDKVVDCNRHMLSSRCKEVQEESFFPLDIYPIRILEDREEDVRETVKWFMHEPGFHILITTGGASVGQFDYNKKIANELGKVYFTSVNMMPGKPITFCKLQENVFWFVLAGNPTSSMVQFDMFIRPIFTNFRHVLSSPPLHVLCGDSFISNDPKRVEYQRVKMDDNSRTVYKLDKQQSSSLISFVNADGYICLDSSKKEGDMVEYIPRVYKPLLDGKIRIGVITCSDRAYAGIYEDKSGLELQSFLKEKCKEEIIIMYVCVSDDISKIKQEIKYLSRWCVAIFTTGGTGPSYRDNTVLVTKECMHKELPGFGEQMRQISLKYVPTAILSGQTAGIIYSTPGDIGCFICNCPGSPKSIRECLEGVWGAIPYCIELASGRRLECEGGYFPKK